LHQDAAELAFLVGCAEAPSPIKSLGRPIDRPPRRLRAETPTAELECIHERCVEPESRRLTCESEVIEPESKRLARQNGGLVPVSAAPEDRDVSRERATKGEQDRRACHGSPWYHEASPDSSRWGCCASGDDSEALLSFDTISLEVVVVDREDRGERFTSGDVHERRIRKVHGTIVVTRHQ